MPQPIRVRPLLIRLPPLLGIQVPLVGGRDEICVGVTTGGLVCVCVCVGFTSGGFWVVGLVPF